MSGAELIAAERRRQVEAEGITAEHDAQHVDGELVRAAICYAYAADSIRAALAWARNDGPRQAEHYEGETREGFLAAIAEAEADPVGHQFGREQSTGRVTPPRSVWGGWWPWGDADWKPVNDRVRNLVKAGALIAAEIDRLERVS